MTNLIDVPEHEILTELPEGWLNAQDMADRMQVSRSGIEAWAGKGFFQKKPFLASTGHKQWIYPVTEVEAHIAANPSRHGSALGKLRGPYKKQKHTARVVSRPITTPLGSEWRPLVNRPEKTTTGTTTVAMVDQTPTTAVTDKVTVAVFKVPSSNVKAFLTEVLS